MKKLLILIINSKFGIRFRLSFLKRIHKEISNNKQYYCCAVNSWHSYFICWKDIREVQDNLNSNKICKIAREHITGQKLIFNCSFSWFDNKYNRILFLIKVISDIEKKLT